MSEVEGFTRAQRIWARIAVWTAFLVVAGSAAVQSFKHIREVALLGHQSELVSYLMPLSIDGMMAIATVAMVEDKAYGRHPRGWARWGLWFGLTVSLAANVASVVAVWGWDWLSIAGAGLPPVLLLWSVEIVSKPGRIRRVAETIARVSGHLTRAEPPQQTAESTPTMGAAGDEEAAPAAPVPASVGDTGPRESTGTPPRPVRTGRPEDSEPLPTELVALARQVGGAWRTKTGREITRDGLRSGLREAGWQRGISNVTAGRLLDLIRADADGQAQQQDTAPVPAGANGR